MQALNLVRVLVAGALIQMLLAAPMVAGEDRDTGGGSRTGPPVAEVSERAADPDWTNEEAETRWNAHAPQSACGKEMKKPIRTDHYIVLGNASGGATFAKKMEENYKTIRALFPFVDKPNRRLMPVFLFRTPEQYREFCRSALRMSEEQAKATKGVAASDFYATWYESPNDRVHLHEATHQVFRNRLELTGGGSWFQEGVAEYASTTKNDRNVVARLVREKKALPLSEMMALDSLLFTTDSSPSSCGKAHERYLQAALFIEFLRESRFGKDRFEAFLHAAGNCRRNDVATIDAAFRDVYGCGVQTVEAKFAEYCKKR